MTEVERVKVSEAIRNVCNEYVQANGACVTSDWWLSRLFPIADSLVRSSGVAEEREALERIVARGGDSPPYSQMALDMWTIAKAALAASPIPVEPEALPEGEAIEATSKAFVRDYGTHYDRIRAALVAFCEAEGLMVETRSFYKGDDGTGRDPRPDEQRLVGPWRAEEAKR
jgi:hypothetical protein